MYKEISQLTKFHEERDVSQKFKRIFPLERWEFTYLIN